MRNSRFIMGGNSGGAQDGFFAIIQPYLKSTQIYQCPSETFPANSDPTTNGYTDYSFNLLLGWSGAEAPTAHDNVRSFNTAFPYFRWKRETPLREFESKVETLRDGL